MNIFSTRWRMNHDFSIQYKKWWMFLWSDKVDTGIRVLTEDQVRILKQK